MTRSEGTSVPDAPSSQTRERSAALPVQSQYADASMTFEMVPALRLAS